MSGGGGRGRATWADRMNDLDSVYAPGWREATLKTLGDDLKQRGIRAPSYASNPVPWFVWLLIAFVIIAGFAFGLALTQSGV